MVYDMWSERALVSFALQGGTDKHFEAITDTVDLDIGNKDFDTIATLSGGRLTKFNPMEPTEVTLECYPLEAATNNTTDGTGFFDLMNSTDSSQPLQISVDKTRQKVRLAIMWTDNTTLHAEDAVSAPTYAAMRFVGADGYITEAKPSFTEKANKWTVKFKVNPFDKAGNANVKIESVYSATTSVTLSALASYTSTTKW